MNVNTTKRALSFEELLQKAHALQDVGRLEMAAKVLEEANRLLEEVHMSVPSHEDEFTDNESDICSVSSASVADDTTYQPLQETLETREAVEASPELKATLEAVTPIQKQDVVVESVVSTKKNETRQLPAAKFVPQPKLAVQEEPKQPQETTKTKQKAVNLQEGLDNLMLENIEHKKSPLEVVNDHLKKQFTTAEVTASVIREHSDSITKRTVTKAGYLLLCSARSGFFKTWRSRYIILTGRLLLIFKSAKSTSCEKVLELPNATVEAVRMQLKAKSHNVFVYEFRLKEHFSDVIYRFRLQKTNKKNDATATKAEIGKWAANVKNNILVSSDSLDMLHSEIESLKRLKGKDSNEGVTLFKKRIHESSSSKDKASSWRDIQEKGKIDRAREAKYFATKQDTRMQILGADIGKRLENESIFKNYKLLKLPPSATSLELKKRYRRFARDYHPDKNMNNKEIAERTRKFAAISQAFHILKFKETRDAYDLCENVKELLRQGVVIRIHRVNENPKQQLLFIDADFLNLYMQDTSKGTVLNKGYRSIELRFVTHIYRGKDGLILGNRDIPEASHAQNVNSYGNTETFLTLHGDRLGQQDWHIQTADEKSRDQLLQGLRKLRCDNSELFKQRLGEMFKMGYT